MGLWHYKWTTYSRPRTPDLIIINKKRELAKLSTLLLRLTTEYNWKNVKRRISTSTLLGNWNNYGTWRWQLYQSWLVLLVFTKVLLKSLEVLVAGDRMETIQTTALLRTARILRRVLKTWEDLLSLEHQWKTIS